MSSCGAVETTGGGGGAGAICTGAEPGAPGGGRSGAAEACTGGIVGFGFLTAAVGGCGGSAETFARMLCSKALASDALASVAFASRASCP